MTTILVHPSRGAKDGRENLKRSLDVKVDFRSGALGASLTGVQRAELDARIPEGRSHFWGTYQHNASKIARVREGDVVLFTGLNEVWAIGVVGYCFDSTAFAEELWNSHPDKGTYRHIYAVTHLERVNIPYAVVNRALGLMESNHFQQMSVYTDSQARAVVDVLHLALPDAHGKDYATQDTELVRTLEADTKSDSPMLAIEQVHTTSTTYQVVGGERLVLRGEGTLVQAFAASLPKEAIVGRRATAAGMTDLCIEYPEHSELVEAKSSADRSYVRQALAQVLHYGPSLTPIPEIASALFPTRPSSEDVDYLHRYGVDCIYRADVNKYVRLVAPAPSRQRLLDSWV